MQKKKKKREARLEVFLQRSGWWTVEKRGSAGQTFETPGQGRQNYGCRLHPHTKQHRRDVYAEHDGLREDQTTD